MAQKMGKNVSVLMGIIILIADLYWTYLAYGTHFGTGITLGVIIFLADIIWLYFDR